MNESCFIGRCLICALVLLPAGTEAYEVATHFDLSSEAFNRSILSSGGLQQLGLKPLSAKQKFPTTPGTDDDEFAYASCRHSVANSLATETVARLIACGAMFEDFPSALPQSRPLNHFFDPAHDGRPLTVPVLPFFPPTLAVGMPSPDWALGVGTPSYQQNSYANALTYFYAALTTPGPQSTRDASWGATFQSIGQVIHHLQDMAQPQHVRNDAHANTAGEQSNLGPLAPSFHASRFEKSTATVQPLQALANSAMQGPVTAVYPAYAAQFAQPRDFWTGAAGIADYTNRNFVSAGTNFCGTANNPTVNADFSLPVPNGWTDISIAQAYSDTYGSITSVPQDVDNLCKIAGQTPDVYLQNCYITMVSTSVQDPLPGAVAVQNTKASTFSIFDEDLRIYDQYVPLCGQAAYQNTHEVFALNNFNFIASYKFLMPHAVAYSAGLINYFFRGQMAINLPSAGVYSIVDQTAQGCKDSCGFTTVKLKLKNTTPYEAMSSGVFQAIAKFHRNTCYQSDLSGDPNGPAFLVKGDMCRGTDEEIVVSTAGVVAGATLTALAVDEEREVTFAFGTPIPINATDIYLQVVFKGTLGVEQGAVAVATKDISEPNYYALQNFTDYVFDPDITDPTVPHYFALPYRGYAYPVDVSSVRIAFGSNSAVTPATAIATLDHLGGGQYAQFAALMERGQGLMSGEWATPGYDYDTLGEQRPFDVQEFTMDDTGPYAGKYTKTCPVASLRGIYRQYSLFFVQQVVHHRVSQGGLKELTVVSSGGGATPSAGGMLRPKAAVDPNCGTLPTDGYFDFLGVSNLTPANAVQWQINF